MGLSASRQGPYLPKEIREPWVHEVMPERQHDERQQREAEASKGAKHRRRLSGHPNERGDEFDEPAHEEGQRDGEVEDQAERDGAPNVGSEAGSLLAFPVGRLRAMGHDERDACEQGQHDDVHREETERGDARR